MKYVEAAVDLDKEIQAKETELIELQSRAKDFIDTIETPLAKKVMKYRYLRCMRWDEVAVMVGYEVSYIRKLEREVVEAL